MKNIITKSRLTVHEKDGFRFYENGKIKDLEGGFYIGIDKNNTLKVEGSLHKYHSFLKTGKSSNFDSFTMHQAKETIFKLIENKGFEPLNMVVNHYEVGMNLNFDFDVIEILNNVHSIGEGITEKKLYINPQYRKERVLTTERDNNKKVVFKTYDKLFEIKNKRGIIRTDVNILRIESELRKVEKTYLLDFFTDTNLTKVRNVFFNKWDKLNFDFNIDAPKGTHKSKIELSKELMRYGIEPTRKKYNNLLKENAITIKIHRSIESFISNWNTNKYDYKIQNTLIYTIWAKCYSVEKQRNTQNYCNV
ncbi:hypothetical protein ACUXZJ_05970 [Flavobacterium sp. TN-1]